MQSDGSSGLMAVDLNRLYVEQTALARVTSTRLSGEITTHKKGSVS